MKNLHPYYFQHIEHGYIVTYDEMMYIMKKEYDAIVVGSGLAGLTSAAYLCRYGFRTLVCEKRKKTGGLVDTFWQICFFYCHS